jgi:phosphatidylglycerophosphate synthase
MIREIVTLPNILSFARLPLALLVIASLDSPLRYFFFSIAVFTDYLDGAAARHFHQTTISGGWLDPLFDKLFVLIVFGFTFAALNLPHWYIAIFFLRDIFTVGSLAVFRKRLPVVKARMSGKFVTFLQFIVLASMIAQHRIAVDTSMGLLLIASIISIVDYAFFFWRTARR